MSHAANSKTLKRRFIVRPFWPYYTGLALPLGLRPSVRLPVS